MTTETTERHGDTRFEPVDLDARFDLCVRFRRDSLVCSFGHDREFEESGGAPAYLEWLRARMAAFRPGIVHAFRGDAVIGQIEMQVHGDEARVNLFYLTPEWRATGAGRDLHAYVLAVLRRRGIEAVDLMVSPSNGRAIRYYEKHGWRRGEVVPGRDDLVIMRLDVAAAK
jgi:ribosomal protein S18 acetylase RimI-like enzyme